MEGEGGKNQKTFFNFFFAKTRIINNSTERTLNMTRVFDIPPQAVSRSGHEQKND